MAPDPLQIDDIKSVQVDVVVEPRPRNAGGRPKKLTVRRFLRICDWIQKGKSNTLACQTEDVDYSGFRAHVRRKPWWRKRYEHADQVRDEYLRDIHLTNIVRHSDNNWQASAWLLERKFPDLFALRSVNRNINSSEVPIGDQVGIEELQRYSRLMLEFAKEQGEQPVLRAMENQAG
jgi:hypothetical protein